MAEAVAASTARVAVGDGILRREVALVTAATRRAVVGEAFPAPSRPGGGSISSSRSIRLGLFSRAESAGE